MMYDQTNKTEFNFSDIKFLEYIDDNHYDYLDPNLRALKYNHKKFLEKNINLYMKY